MTKNKNRNFKTVLLDCTAGPRRPRYSRLISNGFKGVCPGNLLFIAFPRMAACIHFFEKFIHPLCHSRSISQHFASRTGALFSKNLVRVQSQGTSPGGCDQVILAILIHSAVWGKRLEQYAYIIKRRNRLFTVGVETWFQLWTVTSAHHPVLKWMSISKWAERKVQAARKLSPKAAAQNTRLEYE